MWFPTRFRFKRSGIVLSDSSVNKGADQLRGYRKTDHAFLFSAMQIVGFLMRRLISYAKKCPYLIKANHASMNKLHFLTVLLHLRTFFKNFVCAQFSFAHRNVYHLRTFLLLHLRTRLYASSLASCWYFNKSWYDK